MRLNILIGGKAGQGINKISEIVSKTLSNQGYYTFNYRDYPSLIRGGHNFNILSISSKKIQSIESKIDGIIALDEDTIKIHKKDLKPKGFIIDSQGLKDLGINLNLALAAALLKKLSIEKKLIIKEIKKEFNNQKAINAIEKGFNSQAKKFELKKLNNKISIMSGSKGVAQGAINSNINAYLAYPMTPATGVMHELASNQIKNNLIVFQPENETAVVNAALGSSFAGAKTMIGTSGGGFDLMTEGVSMQGMSEIPLTIYLAARPGPATGVPTYSTQADLNIALKAGHGEFPRIVVAPGDPLECIEKTNEAMFLAEKFKVLSIILSDKHLAESEFSFSENPKKPIKSNIKRKLPGSEITKASSYEHDKFGNTTEDALLTKKNAEARLKKFEEIKKEISKLEMLKTHGNKNSKNLIISWGSTKGTIIDAIKELDAKFLQVLYIKPFSDLIKKELEKADKVVLVENNSTGQFGKIIQEEACLKINSKILKYDGRPFESDILREEIKKRFGLR